MADTTTRYSFPYQEADDPPDGASLGQDLAEAVETSLGSIEDALEAADTSLDSRLDTAEADIDALQAQTTPAVTTTTATVGTVATGFAVSDVRAATMCSGKLIDIDLYIQRTGADITASSGNISDTLMFTLATAYRPSHAKSACWGNGTVAGEAIINTDGTINLRSSNGTINGTAGSGLSSIRLSICYILS